MKLFVVHLSLLLGAFLLVPSVALRPGNKRELLSERFLEKVSDATSRRGSRGGAGGGIMGMAHGDGMNMMKSHDVEPALSNQNTSTGYTSKENALLPVQLSLISQKILDGYVKPSELAQDLLNVATFSVNKAFEDSIQADVVESNGGSRGSDDIMLSSV